MAPPPVRTIPAEMRCPCWDRSISWAANSSISCWRASITALSWCLTSVCGRPAEVLNETASSADSVGAADATLLTFQLLGVPRGHIENNRKVFRDVLSSKGDFGEIPEGSPKYREVGSAGPDVEYADSHFPFVHRQQSGTHRDSLQDEAGDIDAGLGDRPPQRGADVSRGCGAERFHFQPASVEPEWVLHRLAIEGITLNEPVQNRCASGRRGGFFSGRKSSLDIVFVYRVGASGNGHSTPIGMALDILAGHSDVSSDDLQAGGAFSFPYGRADRFHHFGHVDDDGSTDAVAWAQSHADYFQPNLIDRLTHKAMNLGSADVEHHYGRSHTRYSVSDPGKPVSEIRKIPGKFG